MKIKTLHTYLNTLFEQRSVSMAVYQNAINTAKSLKKYIDCDVLITSYGTLVFEWILKNKTSDLFSLEIGAKQFGYFIEIEDQTFKAVDLAEFNIKEINTLLSDLKKFLKNEMVHK